MQLFRLILSTALFGSFWVTAQPSPPFSSAALERSTWQRLLTQEQERMSLSPKWAARLDRVQATVPFALSGTVRVQVGGVEAKVLRIDPERGSLMFEVPRQLLSKDDSHGQPSFAPAGGPQPVVISSSREKASGSLNVLGDVVPNKLLLTLKPSSNRSVATLTEQLRAVAIRAKLSPQAFSVRLLQPLVSKGNGSSHDGICGAQLAEISVNGVPLGQALEILEQANIALYADPETGWIVHPAGTTTVPATSGRLVQKPKYTGKGVTIAVLDTGVNRVPPLMAQLLSGYNLVDNNANTADQFGNGHGTPVAILAAGVAPDAKILPVKVCDKNGLCLASTVVRGVCYALNWSEHHRTPLVLNLSLGGDTPVEALKAILKYSLEHQTPVAVSAGNQGKFGSPAHYPAAFDHNAPDPADDLDGLVSTGALDQHRQPADFSTRGENVDIAAPGVAQLGSYTGTSFAAPQVAGMLARCRQQYPGNSAVQLESLIKKMALPVPSATPNQVGAGELNPATCP